MAGKEKDIAEPAEVSKDKHLPAMVESDSVTDKAERCQQAITEVRENVKSVDAESDAYAADKLIADPGSGTMVPVSMLTSVMTENKLLRHQLSTLLQKSGCHMEEYLNIQRYQEHIEGLQEKLTGKSAHCSNLGKEVDHLREEIGSMSAHCSHLGQEVDHLREEIGSMQVLCASHQQQHEEERAHLQHENQRLRELYSQKDAQLKSAEAAIHLREQFPAHNVMQRCGAPVGYPTFHNSQLIEADNETQDDRPAPEHDAQPPHHVVPHQPAEQPAAEEPEMRDGQTEHQPLFVEEDHDQAVD